MKREYRRSRSSARQAAPAAVCGSRATCRGTVGGFRDRGGLVAGCQSLRGLLSTVVALSQDIEAVVLKIGDHELSVYEEPVAERSSDRLAALTSRRDLPIVLAVEPITPGVRSPKTKTTLSQVTSRAHTKRESKPKA